MILNRFKFNNTNTLKHIQFIRSFCNSSNTEFDLFEKRFKRVPIKNNNTNNNNNNNNNVPVRQPENDRNNLKSLPGPQFIPVMTEEKQKLASDESRRVIEGHKNELNEFYRNNREEIEKNLEINTIKKPFALCFGYDGTGFYGLSYNKDLKYKAIENAIEKALFINGHIAPSNVGDLSRIKWSRSSRTDKGVHSLSTLISCFILVDEKTNQREGLSKETIESINKHLPESVRLLSGTRISKSFRARRGVCERTYHYMVPKKYLEGISIDHMNEILSNYIGNFSYHNYTSQRNTYLAEKNKKQSEDDDDEDEGEDFEEENQPKTILSPTTVTIDRISEKKMFRVNPKNMRTVKKFYVESDPILINNQEWFRFVVTVAKKIQPIEALKVSIDSPFIVSTPTAPPFSLYLYEFEFENNKKQPVCTKTAFSDTYKTFKKEFLSNQLHQRFDQIERDTNQFSTFFEELQQHQFLLDDLPHVIELNNEFKREKAERQKMHEERKLQRQEQRERERLEKEMQEKEMQEKENQDEEDENENKNKEDQK
ncbi:hypothetical protein DICPUDRAFT_156689 [Dictyostelium purpureum]|uniref:Pseudouridine synthase I TruA alpha/beta domain-containing protein n=1 Tax=Dictyostelium purpureum TaxID=5786 RepID=F0ZX60_DICPU|nr:uncharacterized protein DICPUDRAFT_156689 [Dictyostelium purpureum]EGC31472.1 hypothetical protein DICPUDRAFT_156689 [Dictyostelium purpureum]|eukprot:XP_003292011.1 hypothetical protein DICPUDRAFT_156689 [Dictyostelium purpureum]